MIVPRPTTLAHDDGVFTLGADTRIRCDPALEPTARHLQEMLRPATGFPLDVSRDGRIALRLEDGIAPEGYRLEVRPDGIDIAAAEPAGAFHACQALRQLLPPAILRRSRVPGLEWSVPCVRIEDAPRFSWRGVMLDVARHFLPKHEVFRFLDLMALHRLNRLQLHLTDDQGWRLEIRRHPRLTAVGSWRRESQVGALPECPGDGRPHGGYYTQDDVREIVAYAAERHITVVPEIETPGHAQAAIAAYPELGVGGGEPEVWTRWGINETVLNVEESTVGFFCDVLDEVVELFDSPFIGVGGDECEKTQWREDPRTQERMRELGVADEEGLQSWFIGRLDAHLASRGRRLLGWDEILEGGLAPGATVTAWRGAAGALAAARHGHDVVACPDSHAYFDYRQSDSEEEPVPVAFPLTALDVYGFEPVPAGMSAEEARHVLGGQANLWSEHIDSPRALDYYAFPRLCALAEALWSRAERDPDEFAERLERHLARLDALGVEYWSPGRRRYFARPGVTGRPYTRAEREAVVEAMTANIAED